MALDGMMPDFPSVEADSREEYIDLDSVVNPKCSKFVSFDTTCTPCSSNGSDDAIVLNKKSPLISFAAQHSRTHITLVLLRCQTRWTEKTTM